MNNDNSKTYIIAEAGVNHNGSLKIATQLIDIALEAGADAVKFQTFNASKVISHNAPKADYQIAMTGAAESQLEMVKKLELDMAAHRLLIEHCAKRKIAFLSAPFDLDSVNLLQSLDIAQFKIPSGEITNAPLLLEVARTKKPIILSTGMSTLSDVEKALSVLAFGYMYEIDVAPSIAGFETAYCSAIGQAILRKNVILLHCTTEYPAPFDEVNLRVMDTLGSAFGLQVGISDHTTGIAVPIAAVARGAVVVEKHFTLDKNMSGPDHRASLEPSELKCMVESIRQVETALGLTRKIPMKSEIKNMEIARKSLVAACPIMQGEKFSSENITSKRPGKGISPFLYWDYLGKTSPRSLEIDDEIEG